ncbi:TonB-dependent receptor [Methylotenera sp.]|uniref:TonB-dependent receptor family protein n=1 Tax=Methylotenera sp. TaxID=2051956 RepID=UPI002722B226|nr:TonB-dependent receptor [Methylotenera sp.]MDO9205160.1 TonB-dependent receptor [Methylotenera sp.]
MSIALPVMADDAASTEQVDSIIMAPVVVTGTRVEQNSFDLPMSIDVTDADQIQEAQLKVNLSESSSRVPGVVINNRNNPAQDLAIQIRGFGARSAFGVRGVRLYADGIPMTMPDGQGQTGTFNLDTASRVEYLRGPFSALYGNSSGGVVQIFTQDGPKDPTLSGGITFGSYNTSRESLSFGDSGDGFDYIVNANTYRSDGYRAQSDTRRDTLHGKINFKFGDDTKLSIVATALDQPDNEDPQGLDAKQLKANRKQAGTGSELFNTRVSRSHQQVGATLEHQFTPDDTVRFMAYYGQRENEQYQSVAIFAQRDDRSGGGVQTIDRDFGGADLRWTHNGKIGENAYNVTAGMNYDRMEDDRKGYENFLANVAIGKIPAFTATTRATCGTIVGGKPIICGVKGNLRRDEINTAHNFDQYLQASIDLHPRWTISGGLRHSRVNFKNEDNYVNKNFYTGVGFVEAIADRVNVDDSGSVTFKETTPVIGAIFKLTDTVNLYANAGESFETPTFVEMAYKPAGSGLNLDLSPAKSRQYEAGIKAMLGHSTLLNASLFKIDTDDEIVLQQQAGGRSVFQNVNSSERKGFELSVDSKFNNGLGAYVAYSYLDAKFTSDFTSCRPFGTNPDSTIQATCLPTVAPSTTNSGGELIKSGGNIPGTFKQTLYGEVSWKYEPVGFSTALEARANSKTYVAFKPEYGSAGGYVVAAWRGGFTQKINNWKFNEFVRAENLFDKDYVGSVRVADLNGRYYEPAPGRNWLLGVNASYKF